MEDVIIKTLLSADAVLKHNYRTCFPNRFVSSACFEVWMCVERDGYQCVERDGYHVQILGYDIILDQRLRPWLLEVNHSPSFTCDSPLDREARLRHRCVV